MNTISETNNEKNVLKTTMPEMKKSKCKLLFEDAVSLIQKHERSRIARIIAANEGITFIITFPITLTKHFNYSFFNNYSVPLLYALKWNKCSAADTNFISNQT